VGTVPAAAVAAARRMAAAAAVEVTVVAAAVVMVAVAVAVAATHLVLAGRVRVGAMYHDEENDVHVQRKRSPHLALRPHGAVCGDEKEGLRQGGRGRYPRPFSKAPASVS